MSGLKQFIKEFKRVRWPAMKEIAPLYLKVLLFTLASSLFLFLISFTFGAIWSAWGVGI